MKNFLFSIALITLIFGQACKPADKSDIKFEQSPIKSSIKYTPPVVKSDSDEKDFVTDPTQERKLTKEATISFETKDFKNACSTIKNLIAKYHGLINTESDNVKENKDLEAEFEARIPAKSFDLFLKELESVDGKIVNKEIKIEDITADYLDVEARLKTKKELEARYLQLLAKATKVTDMLEIEKQLNDQREEIESTEGRFKFMQHEVANNLVHITITEPRIATSGFFGKILHALSNGWSFFIGFLIVLITLWPFMLVGGAIWFFLGRYLKKEKERKRIVLGK